MQETAASLQTKRVLSGKIKTRISVLVFLGPALHSPRLHRARFCLFGWAQGLGHCSHLSQAEFRSWSLRSFHLALSEALRRLLALVSRDGKRYQTPD
jgi:hypothetical protein